MRDPNVIGVVVKTNSILAEEAAYKVIETLKKLGADFIVEESATTYPRLRGLPTFSLEDRESLPPKIIVVGGDGTLLRTFQSLCDKTTLVMAVKAGRRGFLLDVERYEISDRVEDFYYGRYRVCEYSRLSVRLNGDPMPCVLNDAVIASQHAKLVRLNVFRDGERVYSIDGDGLIISTTIGSTAYNLSAGGPIVDPRLDAIVLTPMNPVQLQLRSVVLNPTTNVKAVLRPGSNEASLVLDGAHAADVGPGDIVEVTKSMYPARMARFKWWENYYERIFTRIYGYW